MKLVCKRFYEIFNDASLADCEKLNCCNLYSIPKTLDTIMTYKRKIRNLDFSLGTFTLESAYFWKKIGPELRTLEFLYCKMETGVFELIAHHCKNLSSLKWRGENLLFSNEEFTSLRRNKIVRKNLRYLEVYAERDEWITFNLLCSIFTIFPNIREFILHYNIEQLTRFFSCLQELKTRRFDIYMKLELKIHGPFPSTDVSQDVMKDIYHTAKITETPLLKYDTTMIFKPSDFRYLEVGKFCSRDKSTADFMTFVSKLLDSCPNLRNLELYDKNKGQINLELFKKFLKSSLQILILRFPSLINQDFPDALVQCLPDNYTLRGLCIRNASGTDKYDLRLFLEKFCNLEHLSLHCVSNETVQSLCQFQINLKSLELHLGKYCSDAGFIQSSDMNNSSSSSSFYSMNRLAKLESLKIFIKLLSPLTNNIFNSFTLPNLRYLDLDLQSRVVNPGPVIAFIERSPLIESLAIYNLNASYYDWISICSCLKKLRFLNIGVSKRNSTLDINMRRLKKFFKLCPTLRVFECNERGQGLPVYYDVLEDKIQGRSCTQMRFTTEEISPFYGHWAGINSPEFEFIECSDSEPETENEVGYDFDDEYCNLSDLDDEYCSATCLDNSSSDTISSKSSSFCESDEEV